MESVLIDQSPLNPRKSLALNREFLFRSYHFSSTPSSLQNSFMNVQRASSFGTRPPPYASLPLLPSSTHSFACAPPQPPLLPLPFPKSSAKRVVARSRDQQKKSRPSANPRKEKRLFMNARRDLVSPRKRVEKAEEKVVEEEEEEEIVFVAPRNPEKKASEEEGEGEEKRVVFMGSLHSISPPPSSLPLPTFFLKPKTAVAAPSCTVEAMGSGGGVKSGATDDLRRLLGL